MENIKSSLKEIEVRNQHLFDKINELDSKLAKMIEERNNLRIKIL